VRRWSDYLDRCRAPIRHDSSQEVDSDASAHRSGVIACDCRIAELTEAEPCDSSVARHFNAMELKLELWSRIAVL